jgi:hypothetical protein
VSVDPPGTVTETLRVLTCRRQLTPVIPALTLFLRGRPYVDTVEDSAFTNMKELRAQFRGDPWRILFAFDRTRTAILLVGGNKRGDKRWYKKHLPIADERFKQHLRRLGQEP